MKKVLAAMLALCLLVGCSSALAAEVDLSPLYATYPVTEEKVEMSMAILKGSVDVDPDDIWFWPWIEGLSNVHWDINAIDGSVWSDKKTVMLASGDYPDVFWGPSFTTTEIMTYGQEGYFIPLNDLIAEYAPNLSALLEQYPEVRAQITCPDGNIYSFPYFSITDYSNQRAWINTTWLENLGLEMPTTLDEFYDVLVAFKEQDANGNGDPNDEIPWGGSAGNKLYGRHYVLAGLGFITGDSDLNVAVKNGEACYMPLHEDYRKYLEFANKCWEAGLMEPDIFTQTFQQFNAKNTGGEYITVGYLGANGPLEVVGYEESAWSQFEHVIPLTSEVNDTPMWPKQDVAGVGTMMITDVCKTPEIAVAWMDKLYDPNVAVLLHNGPIYGTETDPDGIGWKPETGTTEPVGLTEANPDNLGWWDYLCVYMVPRNRGTMWFVTLDDFYALDHQTMFEYNRVLTGEEGYWRESLTKNAAEYYAYGYPKVVFYSEEDAQTIKELLTPLDDYVSMMEAKFITGAESFDNYDKFIEEMKKLGADKIDEIYRTTYAAIQAR